MSHTPGPWDIEYADEDGYLYEDGVTIVSCEGPVAFGVIDCSARVVAAAPDLLAALIRMRDEFSGSAQSKAQDDAWAMAQDAIEKAGGE